MSKSGGIISQQLAEKLMIIGKVYLGAPVQWTDRRHVTLDVEIDLKA